MSPMRSEQPPQHTGTTGVSSSGDAPCDARGATSGPSTPSTTEPSPDPDLALVSGVWSRLPGRSRRHRGDGEIGGDAVTRKPRHHNRQTVGFKVKPRVLDAILEYKATAAIAVAG